MTNNAVPQEPNATPQQKSKLEIARQKAAQANALLQKLEAQARSKAVGENRKLNTRRKVLLGAFMLGKIQKDDEFKKQIVREIDKYLVRDAERALFDLPPLPRTAPATATTTIL